MNRYFTAFGLSVLVTFSLFYLMQFLVSGNPAVFTTTNSGNTIDIIRLKLVENVVTKQRLLPEPPKAPVTPNPVHKFSQAATKPELALPTLKLPLPGIPALAMNSNLLSGISAEISSPAENNDVIALLKVEPDYPRSAASKGIEGWVKLEFTVLEDGTVADIKVLESSPKRVFDRSAMRALQRWKFKPRIVNGKPEKQRAIQVIEFKLN
jgi:protein TonB